MALRLIEAVIPEGEWDTVEGMLGSYPSARVWREEMLDRHLRVKVLLDAGEAEPVVDMLAKQFAGRRDFHLLLLPVEAALPRPDLKRSDGASPVPKPPSPPATRGAGRISREELYADVVDMGRATAGFMALVVLSSVVAAIGLLRDDMAITIGAMVIAPVLGPNVALSMATTLGDTRLARSALKTLGAGVLAALILPAAIGAGFGVDTTLRSITLRTGSASRTSSLPWPQAAPGWLPSHRVSPRA